MDDASVLFFYVADVFELLFYVAHVSILSFCVAHVSFLSFTYYSGAPSLRNQAKGLWQNTEENQRHLGVLVNRSAPRETLNIEAYLFEFVLPNTVLCFL